MIDYTETNVDKVSVHHIGNRNNGEDIVLSQAQLDLSDFKLRQLLLDYFLSGFKTAEFYSFTFTNEDFKRNAMFDYSSEIFEGIDTFHMKSCDIAKHLFELSNHPQIKSGDLFVAHFTNLNVENEAVSAIGIFKSENRQPFLKLNQYDNEFILKHDVGINIEKVEKGCLILNIEKEEGYKVCLIDKSSKSNEAQFWKDSFLMLKPRDDEFHKTKEIMNITKNYVAKQMTDDFRVNKTDQIDILNRSLGYFKTHESYNKKEFEQDVLRDDELINSFQKFEKSYKLDNAINLEDNFNISTPAVKKQAKIFKSILKLDKNFHVYIHGNRELIEQGTEADGRRYYKLYYIYEE